MPFSVLLIIKHRQSHLVQVLAGIAQSTLEPTEIIIIHMNEAITLLDSELPIKQFTLHSKHALPLAAARNLAANQATTERLIFLDVDCIPEPDCFAKLLNDLQTNQLAMADPQYLQQPVQALDFTVLAATSRPNPARQDLTLGSSNRYELFWSLGFAITKLDFKRINGFDESYTGYGGEDTDFAFRARQANLRLYYSQARVYHQNHPSYDPPLNWLADIVTNAQHFYAVWQMWPMEGWLTKFVTMGYIKWSVSTIEIVKLPTAAEIAAVQIADAL